MQFIKGDNVYSKYYDIVYLLLNTGLRISELAGLTIGDVNLCKRKIKIDHQLLRKPDMEYMIESTKTGNERFIPMTDEVYDCFKSIVARHKTIKIETVINGKSGFLFLNINGTPMIAKHFDALFNRIVAKYNKTNKEKLSNITPHVLRHTYCTRMALAGMNPKILQYIMGHSDISMTLNYYTHVDFDNVEKEMRKIKKIS